ncbi:hypothetical protein [Nocardioides caricicola]|uniref:TolB family protein n=1 Tax=Nocardioides caricicola TaxID=634770 RepID=A0ABW0MW97_9ACTN
MSDLRDPLDDLLSDVPTYVVPDARAAWAAGARRRTRRRVGVAAAVTVVVALVAGAVTWLPRTVEPQPADGEGVGGYPARVLKPLVARDLPLAPGPMAMVFQRNGEDIYGWWVASPRGHAWPVPQQDMIDSYPPALSADGRMLAYLHTPTTYVIRDLTTGDSTTFDSITDGLESREGQGEWVLGPQNPSFWSPDGSRVLVRGSSWSRDSPTTALVLDVDGTVTELETDGFPAGWVDDDTLAFVQDRAELDGKPPAELVLVRVDGAVERRITLALPRAAAAWTSQWSSSVSPDGEFLAFVADDGQVYVFSTEDGARRSRSFVPTSDTCLPSWQDDFPALVRTSTLVGHSGEVLTAFDSRLEVVCAMAAPGALAGERHVGLAQRWFGDGWVAFNLPLAVAIAVGGVVVAGVVLLVIRNRRRRVHRLG